MNGLWVVARVMQLLKCSQLFVELLCSS